jgi:hypothetical protein
MLTSGSPYSLKPPFSEFSGPLQYALSSQTLKGLKEASALTSSPSPGSITSDDGASPQNSPLEEKLYVALSEAKVLTSRIAMHLDKEWRNRLFRQLDSLHSSEEWDIETEPLQRASFATFLRSLHSIGIKRRPGLGLSYGGNLIGAWTVGPNRLTLEFLPYDSIRWVLTRERDGALDRAAGETRVSRIASVLSPYEPQIWFDGVGQKNT